MATTGRQNKRILDMLAQIIERLDRLDGGQANEAESKPAAKKTAAKKDAK